MMCETNDNITNNVATNNNDIEQGKSWWYS